MILSIDISTNHYGLIVAQDKEIIHYESKDISKLKKIGELEREKFLFNKVLEICTQYPIDIILTEEYYLMNNVKTLKQLQTLYGLLLSVSFLRNSQLKSLGITAYRKHLNLKTKKRADIKIEIYEIVKALYPNIIIDKEYDISDAIGMWIGYNALS